ncbi:glycosyltransferase family 90 protein [Chaetomium fimeti]|uniref:Glycosyltransferase family 90 protein n=1 Tax=Chaetomium fimeti TaxID=1854472 RepID=A0AAE0LWP5_9PEZI|nr:glycosyltransferase family 90 protein [Chaetomium fimeti]
MANQLTALCTVTSFLWLAYSLEDHQIIEQPRLSSLLVLSIAALSSYAASFCSVWLPGTNGRFDDERAPLKVKRANLPNKPRRYFLPALVLCIILRLEIFHRVSLDLQCSKPGLEAFLPLLILLYELRSRRARSGDGDDEEEDDMGLTIFEAFGAWFYSSRGPLFISVLMLTLGTYLVSSLDPRSTFFCSNQDRSALVVLLQWAGLFLDASIAIIMWRILAWARTTKSRLRTLSGIILVAALGAGLLYRTFRLFVPVMPMSYQFRGLDSLYVFDVVVDGLAFSTFVVSASLLAGEGSPSSLAGILAFLFGIMQAIQKTALTGTWENISPGTIYFALTLICLGFSFFVYLNNIRSVIFIHRAFFVFLLFIITIIATIYTPIKALQITDKHPLIRTIYDARTEADRWMVHATVSNSLPVAVQEYKERHNGRDPPQKFDIWYDFAKDRHSVILDDFQQMEEDILPFWGMPPSKIKEGIQRAAAEPDMALLQIQGGEARHNLPPSSPYKPVVDDLVDLVKDFVKHLPNMELAINLNERPRVLAPWDDVQRFINTANRKRVSKLLPRSSDSLGEMPAARATTDDNSPTEVGFTPVRALRQMTALTCPPGTKGRAGTHWDIRDICTSCARPQSQGQYLTNWPLSQSLCHQPDLLRLHSFHMTPPEVRPLQELLPVFSRAKTDSYRDILIPLRRISEPADPPTDGGFENKFKRLFWRGRVDRSHTSPELIRGGHQERLVHLLNTPTRSEKTTLLLPSKDRFTYEQVPTAAINDLLPMDVAFSTYTACKATTNTNPNTNPGNTCPAAAAAAAEFLLQPSEPSTEPSPEPLEHKYVLLTDTDTGPSPHLLRTIRSSSVPLHATIFREWFSERLRPWVHFVPIDVRLHGLHGTVAYFLGLHKRGGRMLNGREVVMEGRTEDAKWIAEQGRRWAGKAITYVSMVIVFKCVEMM